MSQVSSLSGHASCFRPVSCTAQAGGKVDVTGTWKAEFDTQIGLQKYTFTLKQDGTAISGKASVDTNGEKRDVTFKEGKIDGDKLTLIELLAIQGKDVRVTFTGKASVDQIKFTRQVGDLGSSEATAKRVASDPAKPAPGKGAGKDGKGGFGGPIKLGPDDKPAFPDAPAGFNAARDKVPHGDVKVVEYDSKTLGTRRAPARLYAPRLCGGPQVPSALSAAWPGKHQHRMDATGQSAYHRRQLAG